MSKSDNNAGYIYIVVPEEYSNLYVYILELLAEYGECTLKDCHCSCSDKSTCIIECYNLFNAAIAAKEVGKDKLAGLIINYIKARLNYKEPDVQPEPTPTPEPQPVEDTCWYVGQITATRPEFEALTGAALIQNATAYSVKQKTVDFNINKSCWYVLVPDGVHVSKASYTSSGIVSVVTQYEIEHGFITNVTHDDIEINGITYHVYVNRGSSLVDSNTPASFTIK